MKRISFLTLLTLLLIFSILPATAQAFIDTRSHWAAAAIDHLYTRGIVQGYTSGYYRPDIAVTREEFVVTLMKSLHKDADALSLQKGDATFEDTAATWGKGYIELARELGIANGDTQNRFYPKSRITREEAAALLVRSLPPAPPNPSPLPFKDSLRISTWAWQDIGISKTLGLISGYPDNTFRPQQPITRAEAAILIENLITARGDRYHFYGIIQELDVAHRKAYIVVNGKQEAFELAQNIPFYSDSTKQLVSEIALPSTAYFDVDSTGSICYVILTDGYKGAQVNLTITGLPSYLLPSASSDSPNLFNLLNQETDTLRALEITRPDLSLEITKDAMEANAFTRATGATGKGQLVAVIDSGIDPGHPDLQTTSEGYRKILDYIDLTGEGRIPLTAYSPVNGLINMNGLAIDVKNLPNKSSVVRLGYLTRKQLPAQFAQDIKEERILVAVTAQNDATVFDTLYLDTDFDGQINDEVGLRPYALGGQYATVKGSGQSSLHLAVTGISKDGQYANLGYDTLGHGTQVAGIVAARGQVTGVAPDAQLLSIKVVDQWGSTNLNLLKQAISLAADRGAKIVVLSLGQNQLSPSQKKELAAITRSAHQVYGMIICAANGNSGPGLGTSAGSASLADVFSVGAYATPGMWLNDYGYQVKEPTLWYFSSVGPGSGGSLTPLVVAPGSAVSTYPSWTGQLYHLDEGSSLAAPHAAGAAALLMDAISHSLYQNDTRAAWAALLAGAEPLKGYYPVEQGFGAINLLRSWDELQLTKKIPSGCTISQSGPGYTEGSGWFSRGMSPAQTTLIVKNSNVSNSDLGVGSLAAWMQPSQQALQLPAGNERNITVTYTDLPETGLYNNFIVLDNPDTIGFEAVAMQTIVVPTRLGQLPGNKYQDADALYAGRYKRYHFEIEQGSPLFTAVLASLNKGKSRLFVISPQGETIISPYTDTMNNYEVHINVDHPEAGIWEVVVYSSISLVEQDLEYASYSLEIQAEINANLPLVPASKYLATCFSTVSTTGEIPRITIRFWNPVTKQPAQGFVAVEGKLYELVEGRVEINSLDTSIVNIAV